MSDKRRRSKINPTYSPIIDELVAIANECDVTNVALAELVGIGYITMSKYLTKERYVSDEIIARRMVVTTNLLKEMLEQGLLPIPPEVSYRLKTAVILETVDTYLKNKIYQ